uniref:Uncharacterized protein n=1 Tax=Romanomermis culicivorax TaxID=13658 RepID=A0A915KU23_ROMCU
MNPAHYSHCLATGSNDFKLMSHFADDCIVDTSAATFDLALFKQLDEDRALLREIARGCAQIARLHPELQHVADDESPPPSSMTATTKEQPQFPTSHLNYSATNGDTSPTICDKIGKVSATSG